MHNVLGGIGNTPLVELKKVVPPGSARVIAKLEWANPTGSMKDRMAKVAIERAEADGRLAPEGTVVEYTAGTTGISLAFVCAAKGHPIEVVFSDAFSDEKRRTMKAFGARVTDIPSEGRGINAALIKAMIAKANEISTRPVTGSATSSTTRTPAMGTCRSARRCGSRRRDTWMRSCTR